MKSNILALLLGKGANPIPKTEEERDSIPTLKDTQASDLTNILSQIELNSIDSKFKMRNMLL